MAEKMAKHAPATTKQILKENLQEPTTGGKRKYQNPTKESGNAVPSKKQCIEKTKNISRSNEGLASSSSSKSKPTNNQSNPVESRSFPPDSINTLGDIFTSSIRDFQSVLVSHFKDLKSTIVNQGHNRYDYEYDEGDATQCGSYYDYSDYPYEYNERQEENETNRNYHFISDSYEESQRHLAETQRPETEDIASLGSANHPSATDPSDLISRSSRLDYNDHNTGGASHRTCKSADVNRHKNSTGDTVLSDVASELKATEKTSDDISHELAILIDDLMFKKEKIDEEKIKEKLAKILRPNNCHSLVTTKVDDLMWRRLQSRTKTFDYKLQLVQSQIIKGVTILSKTIDSVLKLKASIGQGKPNQSTPSNSNVSDDNSSATQENSTDNTDSNNSMWTVLNNVIRHGIYAIELFSNANFDLNLRRRDCIKPDLTDDYQTMFSSSVPINEYLFGGDISKRLEDIDKSNRAVKKAMPMFRSQSNTGFYYPARGVCILSKGSGRRSVLLDPSGKESSSQGVYDYEIVIPEIYTSDGIKITDSIYHKRHKRSITQHNLLKIDISSLSEQFQLELWENKELLAPGFKVYHRKDKKGNSSDEAVSSDEIEKEAACLYTGKATSHENNTVALSVCDGIKGVIRTAEEDYIIEPVEHHIIMGFNMDNKLGKPHRLYKRSTLQPHQSRFEGTKHRYSALGENPYTDPVHREKRSSFKWIQKENKEPKTVETLVVVDKTMFHRHGDSNITTYTLTLFNMVSKLFQDSSLGNSINIVLVGLILLEGDEPGLTISNHADKTLNSFCSWQSVLIGANGRQHDHAILLTGLDLCSYKNAPCDTLGFAPIEGMCNRIRSCTINEDTGLATALTIAHEMGHNIGMFHDGESNYCQQSAGSIMSPTLMGKDGKFSWSVCSKAYLMRFLNTPQADCLQDKPKHVAELKFPEKLPGELYNADTQCKWQFGNRARLCTYDFGKDICKALWCFRGNKRCETKFLPAAEGTSCGSGMWCREGSCVKYGKEGPTAVNGGWSQWTNWTSCTRPCDQGVMTRDRECNNPLPQYGGKPCPGKGKEVQLCNTQKCSKKEDFHAKQCSLYNKKPFRGWQLQWKPHKKVLNNGDPCKLFCMAETFNYVFTIKHPAVDGTPCGEKDNKICISGACKMVGCDNEIGSTAEKDRCGVCKGDNSTCKLVSGQYTQQPTLNTYFPIVVLPKGARHILINENKISSNYLSIRNIYGRYYLNGDRRVAWPGRYKLGGALFEYDRPYNDPETLVSEGPLEEDLIVEMLVQDHNPGVSYQYTIPQRDMRLKQTLPTAVYKWSVSSTPCSEPCAGGKKTVSVVCHRNLEQEVDASFCKNEKKPNVGVQRCNTTPCPPRWLPGEWQSCTKSCGGGKQLRKITCRQKITSNKDRKLRKKYCKHLPKPAKRRICGTHRCPSVWHVGKWSKCSVMCGTGKQERKVLCRNKELRGFRILPDAMCKTNDKPPKTRHCKKRHCVRRFEWILSPWGPCSKTCGQGHRSRFLKCNAINIHGKRKSVRERNCRHKPKPNVRMEEACWLVSCPQALLAWQRHTWHVSDWTQCSASCGHGFQRRNVKCVDKTAHSRSTRCLSHLKPTTSKPCDSGTCPSQDEPVCEDKEVWCPLVRHHRACGQQYYRNRCCKTCERS